MEEGRCLSLQDITEMDKDYLLIECYPELQAKDGLATLRNAFKEGLRGVHTFSIEPGNGTATSVGMLTHT